MEQKKQKLSIDEKIKLQREKLRRLEEQAREKKKRDSEQMKRALFDLLEESGLGDLTIEDWQLMLPTLKAARPANGNTEEQKTTPSDAE